MREKRQPALIALTGVLRKGLSQSAPGQSMISMGRPQQ